MSLIKTSSTRKKNDYVIVDLGEEYSGRVFTIYKGRKSTGTKVTEGELDADGRFRFEAAGYGNGLLSAALFGNIYSMKGNFREAEN